jgi:hypothetical protein
MTYCKHGHGKNGHRSPEYTAWANMLNRCRSVTAQNRHRYGGRGITVCDRWLDFENFLADMGNRPSARYSLDREDNDKGYSPENCRWADLYTQANNTRRNVFLTFNGETLTIAQWASRLGLNVKTLAYRVRAGWSAEEALTIPLKRTRLPIKQMTRRQLQHHQAYLRSKAERTNNHAS